MQCKGNIEILDETKSEVLSSCIRKNEDITRLKGNVEIIDETKEREEHATESSGNGNEACRNSEGSSVNESKNENVENGEQTGQENRSTDTRDKNRTQDKDTNNNTKLSTDKESNGTDDCIIPHSNENNSFSFEGKGMCREICEGESYIRDATYASENELSNNSNTENNELADGRENERMLMQAKSCTTESGAAAMKGELTPGSEHSSNMSFEKASDVYADSCDFCKSSSDFMCKFCTFFYCKSCLDRVHPAIGPYKSHKVIPVQSGARVEHHNRCRDHGLVAQLFCYFCELNRCTECVKTRCRLHFNGRISAADIEKEKELLVEELEKATAKLGFLEKYKENVQDQIDNIQDVAERVDNVVNTLQTSVRALELEDARLTTTVTELVQSRDDAYFIEEYVNAKDLCHEVDGKVRDFNRNWAKNCTFTPSPLLDNNFTMIVEKKQLSERLDATMELPQLKFKESTLFIDNECKMINISDYLEQPVPPTSTELSFSLHLSMDGIVVYKKITEKLQDLALNTLSTYQLKRGNRYLLKVTPMYTRLANGVMCSDTITWQGKPCHMLIVVNKFRPRLVKAVSKKKMSRRAVRR
ncbi:uncharacterized protein LOC123547600 isoform X2 [Mercenaria mercenaria]|uniref:uncharacterized protein LOC123547600 isoform X2 n=1 Tax=Mercenaria mercenaria TaxID=6596 RepID=UPI00234ED22B|nr:uncharacterized protein LOC123547600 isoform X2 [Mercenaria mercenaria]